MHIRKKSKQVLTYTVNIITTSELITNIRSPTMANTIIHILLIHVYCLAIFVAVTTGATTNRASNTTDNFKNVSREIQTLNTRVAYLETERNTRNGICQILGQPCGNCLCVEDYSLNKKYFCDCRERPVRRDCKDHHKQGERTNGLYKIYKNFLSRILIQVYCDQTTDGGGWIVIQRRMDGSENFFRNWTEYKSGFGHLHREHWLGNQNIYLLTNKAFWEGAEVRFDMSFKRESRMRFAKYSSFEVENEASGYKLHVSGYSGNVGNYFTYNDGSKFSTYDRDNDVYSSVHCAQRDFGAWWHKSCTNVNLNSQYDQYEKQSAYYKRLSWYTNRIIISEIKVRRK